jgi:hypothetical protein
MEVSLFREGLVDCNQGKERKMAIAQENLEKQWENIQPQLLDEYGEGTYTSWIKPLTFMDMKNGCFRLAAPTTWRGRATVRALRGECISEMRML